MMNDYQPSDELVAHVKLAEDLVLVPRPDPVGIVTYGYGHRTYAGEYIPPAITEEFADLTLAADLHKAAITVRQLVTVEMTQGQFDALCDFEFNLGAGALAKSTMLGDINLSLWSLAASECKRWVHDHAGHVLGGLVARRAWDADRLDPEPAAEAPWNPNNEIREAPLIFPPIDVDPTPPVVVPGGGGDFAGGGATGEFAPITDGAANVPTLTEAAVVEQPTPQQIEALASAETPAAAPATPDAP